jgi:anti-sigma-K factor RskA
MVELTGQYQQALTQINALTNRVQVFQTQSAELAAANRAALERLDALTATNLAAMEQIANLTLSNRMALALAVELAGTNSALQLQLAEARNQTQWRTFTSTNAEALVVWNNKDQKGLLQVSRLPPLAQGKDYQLWVIDEKKGPVSAGVIPLEAGGTATYAFNTVSPIEVPKQFAISLEQKGGSPAPTDVRFASN